MSALCSHEKERLVTTVGLQILQTPILRMISFMNHFSLGTGGGRVRGTKLIMNESGVYEEQVSIFSHFNASEVALQWFEGQESNAPYCNLYTVPMVILRCSLLRPPQSPLVCKIWILL